MTQSCKKCSGTEFTPAGKCCACQKVYNDKYRAKRLAKSGVTAKPKAARVPTVSVAMPSLKIEAAWGIEASLDDGYLHLKQCDSEGKADEITLSRAEAKRLFEEFEEWATC